MKKSILFLIPTLGGGGAERVLINLVNNLDPKKYVITVQTIFRGGVNAKYLKQRITFIEGKIKQFPANTYLLKIFNPTFLYRCIVGKRYDIVVAYLEGPAARIVSGCPYKDSKLISWVHVEQHTLKAASHSYRSMMEVKRCNAKFDATVCVAESVKNDFLSIFPEVENCIVLYNTNEDEMIRQQGSEVVTDLQLCDEPNVFSVGRLTEAKGYDRLIKVHKRLIDEGVKHHVFVLGTGDMKPLDFQVKALNVQDTFHFLGYKDNPYKYVSKADLFICSSRREGFSTAVTEAMILGVPVVMTECSGAFEQCGHNNEYGIVVHNSIDGIYEGLKTLLSDHNLLQQYKQKAVERGEIFSKIDTIKAVEHLFDNL